MKITFDQLDAIICEEETPSVPNAEIVFDVSDDDDDDAALVTIESVDTDVVMGWVEQDLARASEASTLRLPRVSRGIRVSPYWLALAVVAMATLVIGFVFGLGMIALGDMLTLSGRG